ncbi:MAG: hypothetical protein LBM98_07710 [Oscillospiraceae bacterium]|nr:hypothetical protein [Oscillospiraceae bacterium]
MENTAHGAGNHPGATRHPSQEGNGRRTRGNGVPLSYPRPTLVLFPSWEGCPRRGGVVVPPISQKF